MFEKLNTLKTTILQKVNDHKKEILTVVVVTAGAVLGAVAVSLVVKNTRREDVDFEDEEERYLEAEAKGLDEEDLLEEDEDEDESE